VHRSIEAVDVSKKPNGPAGRALTDESELDDEALDRIIGGAGARTEGQDENDGWSRIVDDHFKEIPAKSQPTGAPGRTPKSKKPDDR
jgi:hypothetical protein